MRTLYPSRVHLCLYLIQVAAQALRDAAIEAELLEAIEKDILKSCHAAAASHAKALSELERALGLVSAHVPRARPCSWHARSGSLRLAKLLR